MPWTPTFIPGGPTLRAPGETRGSPQSPQPKAAKQPPPLRGSHARGPCWPSSESQLKPSRQAVPSSPAPCRATPHPEKQRHREKRGRDFCRFRESLGVSASTGGPGPDRLPAGPGPAAGAMVLAVPTHSAGLAEGKSFLCSRGSEGPSGPRPGSLLLCPEVPRPKSPVPPRPCRKLLLSGVLQGLLAHSGPGSTENTGSFSARQALLR